MELSVLILVCIHKSYIVYLEIYVVPIFIFWSWKINVEKEGACTPCRIIPWPWLWSSKPVSLVSVSALASWSIEVNTQLRLESDAWLPVICRFEITKHCGLYWRGCQPYSLHPRLRQHAPSLRHKYDILFAVEILAVFVAAAGEISLLAYLHTHTCLFTHVS